MPDFKLTIPLQKSERTDGWYITGVAAGTEVDTEGDVLTPECIQKFVNQINNSPVPFRDWHAKNTILSDMGQVEKAWVLPDFQMGVEVELDQDHPGAQYLWRSLDKGKQYGMSVEGKVHDYEYDTARKSNTGRFGRDIKDVTLDEISATTKPIYTPSFGTVLRKAIDEAEAESVRKGETTVETVTPTADAPETQTLVEEVATPTTSTETPVVAKAVNAKAARDAITELVKHHQAMNAIIEGLGLSDGAIATKTDSTETVETAKSATDPTDTTVSLVKSAINEATASLRAEIESLRERIPETKGPGVLVSKSEAEEAAEIVAELRKDPRRALRAGLAAQRGEVFNG